MWRQWRRRFAAVTRELRDTFAFLREALTTTIRKGWTAARDWALDVTSEARVFSARGRAGEIVSAALTLALAALLLGPYLLVRAIARHVLAYRQHADLPVLWYSLLVYALCWIALGAVTLVWRNHVVSLDVAAGLLATIVWVFWCNGLVIYHDTLLRQERSARMLVTGMLRAAWWSDL